MLPEEFHFSRKTQFLTPQRSAFSTADCLTRQLSKDIPILISHYGFPVLPLDFHTDCDLQPRVYLFGLVLRSALDCRIMVSGGGPPLCSLAPFDANHVCMTKLSVLYVASSFPSPNLDQLTRVENTTSKKHRLPGVDITSDIPRKKPQNFGGEVAYIRNQKFLRSDYGDFPRLGCKANKRL